MAWDKNLTLLREAFANLYQEESHARRVAEEAGLKVGNVTFSAQANSNWYAILSEAEKQGIVESLIDIGLKEYPQTRFSAPELAIPFVAFDDTSMDFLSPMDVRDAISLAETITGRRINVLGFDADLTATVC